MRSVPVEILTASKPNNRRVFRFVGRGMLSGLDYSPFQQCPICKKKTLGGRRQARGSRRRRH